MSALCPLCLCGYFQDSRCRAAAGARCAEPGSHFAQVCSHLIGSGAVVQQCKSLASHALGRAVVLNQLRHDAAAGDQIGHAEGVDLHERVGPVCTSTATACRESPSASRATRSARSRSPRRSARRRRHAARRRCVPRRWRRRRRRDRARRRVTPTAWALSRARTACRDVPRECASSRRPAPAAMRALRLDGSQEAAPPPARRDPVPARVRKASRDAVTSIRSMSGWPTNSTGTPARS